MEQPQIRFDDGAAYEDFMGKWSHLAGAAFLDWLQPAQHLRWLDVGCGNGAFTQMLAERCAPSDIDALDPSEGQLKFARLRPATKAARYQQGDAMALPYADGTFDAAVMALVIFFVPVPEKGVSEMVRVVAPGGSVSAYAWDITGGGFPYATLQDEIEALGFTSLWPPSIDAARIEKLRELWTTAGVVDVQTTVIEVKRSFPDFDTFWHIGITGPSPSKRLAEMSAAQSVELKENVRKRMAPNGGEVLVSARANAVKGTMPR